MIDLNEDYLLPLDEFVKLPTTVSFNVVNTERFQIFLKDRPYIRLGTELANKLIIAYTNKDNIVRVFNELGNDFLEFFPKILSPLDSKSNEASGITQVLNQPVLNLSGRGVIIGFIDTGIDYTKDAFKFEDGTTKILSIWDQTIDGDRPDDMYYGAVYSSDQINEALSSDNPFDIVPSRDEDGHGTFLASVASSNEKDDYIGAAPKSYIISVKLRRANQFYIDMFLVNENNPNLFESSDCLTGLRYIFEKSQELNMPVVACIGVGSNMSGHDGYSPFEKYINFVTENAGFAAVTACGNESNTRHHTQGKIVETGTTDTVTFKTGGSGSSFSIFIYTEGYDKMSVGISSPTGDVIPRIPFSIGSRYTQRLLFENTVVSVEYFRSVNTIIFIRFERATQGIWDITLYGDIIVSGEYYAWLPITGQVDEGIEFLKPIPEYTIVYPATSTRCLTCGAYNSNDRSLFVSSSWGPTRHPDFAPDFVAPGVNVAGTYPTGRGTMTGTSVSAAIVSGASALLLEWGILQGNMSSMDGPLIKALLISGCERNEGVIYPNNKWGFGRINLYRTFVNIQEFGINYIIEL
jgi:subtilisin family serine protease